MRHLIILPFLACACPSALAAAGEDQRLNDFLDQAEEELIAMSPEFQTSLGRKTNYDKWDDHSYDEDDRHHAWYRRFCDELAGFHPVGENARSNLAVAQYTCQQEALSYRWRFHDYIATQMHSPFDSLAAFLINRHRIASVADAQAYITRVATMDQVLRDIVEKLHVQEQKGVLPPSFVFPKVIANIEEQMKGRPFARDGEDTPILADFRKKISGLDIDDAERKALLDKLIVALTTSYQPALEYVIDELTDLQKETTEPAGVWKLPDGAAYYDAALELRTTTKLSASAIHERGLADVARIEDEMRNIMKSLGYKGTLQAFFEYLREDPSFRYPDTEAGRNQYVADTEARFDEIKKKLPDWFGTLPKADLIVKRVEPFREKNTFAAFYERPSLDGTRPGIYYVPSYRISELLKWQRDSTAYHEGIPGHHMQIAIAQELAQQPLYIRLRGFTAFSEGWALYAENLASDMGVYEGRPYADFGRLASEIFRSIRLVVDTGIHSKKWTRQQAVDYMTEHSPLAKSFIVGEIDRYCVMPGQATAYKTGMMKILALRARAKDALGDEFDIRGFHDAVLTHGAVPLGVLEQNVDNWIAAESGRREMVVR